MKIDNGTATVAQVVDPGILLVGLDGFTITELATIYPSLDIGLHVMKNGKWVPVTMDDIDRGKL